MKCIVLFARRWEKKLDRKVYSSWKARWVYVDRSSRVILLLIG